MPDPMYRQIAEDLRRKIGSGVLGHGDQLPTELELREQYDASRGTIRDAVKWLVIRGHRRHQERYIDGTSWSLQTTFYPLALAQRGADRLLEADNIKEGAVAYLRASIGLKQAGYRDTINVRAPNAPETAFFKLPDDGRVAVFEVRRTAFDDQMKPFRLTVSVYPADRSQFAVNVGHVPALADPDAINDQAVGISSGRSHA